MQIPSYQIQNVLKVYSKQLTKGRGVIDRIQNSEIGIYSSEKLKISAEGKKAAIIEKVAAGIVDKITNVGSKEKIEKEREFQLEQEMGSDMELVKRRAEEFIFSSIDENNQKITQTLSVEDSNFILKRMTELAKEAAD
ncbi:MAG: hypothetical protein HQK68_08880 [Desulfamplus sp.]|nr:hypothetical protein [Desulfamplus sp.]